MTNEDEPSSPSEVPRAGRPQPAWTYNPLVLVAAILLTAWYTIMGMSFTWDIYIEQETVDPRIEFFAPASAFIGPYWEFLLVRRLWRRLRAMFQ